MSVDSTRCSAVCLVVTERHMTSAKDKVALDGVHKLSTCDQLSVDVRDMGLLGRHGAASRVLIIAPLLHRACPEPFGEMLSWDASIVVRLCDLYV
jgi:hypothetical protein